MYVMYVCDVNKFCTYVVHVSNYVCSVMLRMYVIVCTHVMDVRYVCMCVMNGVCAFSM